MFYGAQPPWCYGEFDTIHLKKKQVCYAYEEQGYRQIKT